MGCTHFPIVIPLIRSITGDSIQVIDPAPAVARQVKRVLANRLLLSGRIDFGDMRFFTSGSASALEVSLLQLIGVESRVEVFR
jgi:glutamate racemase